MALLDFWFWVLFKWASPAKYMSDFSKWQEFGPSEDG